MTMPQIIMLNHAAWVNSKRMDARIKQSHDSPEPEDKKVFNGKSLDEMNTNDMLMYYGNMV